MLPRNRGTAYSPVLQGFTLTLKQHIIASSRQQVFSMCGQTRRTTADDFAKKILSVTTVTQKWCFCSKSFNQLRVGYKNKD